MWHFPSHLLDHLVISEVKNSIVVDADEVFSSEDLPSKLLVSQIEEVNARIFSKTFSEAAGRVIFFSLDKGLVLIGLRTSLCKLGGCHLQGEMG